MRKFSILFSASALSAVLVSSIAGVGEASTTSESTSTTIGSDSGKNFKIDSIQKIVTTTTTNQNQNGKKGTDIDAHTDSQASYTNASRHEISSPLNVKVHQVDVPIALYKDANKGGPCYVYLMTKGSWKIDENVKVQIPSTPTSNVNPTLQSEDDSMTLNLGLVVSDEKTDPLTPPRPAACYLADGTKISNVGLEFKTVRSMDESSGNDEENLDLKIAFSFDVSVKKDTVKKAIAPRGNTPA